jgi:nucleoside-triphosphatase THEP1
MKIAFLMSDGSFDPNRALAELAQSLLDQGWRVVGTTQTNIPRQDTHKCDMDVRILPDGAVIRISQNLGPNSRGCQLDPDALEQAVSKTNTRLADADILIINKFGKHEATGRGFRQTIADAMEAGLPVVVGTNGLNLDAFISFTGGTAEPLSESDLGAWTQAALKR